MRHCHYYATQKLYLIAGVRSEYYALFVGTTTKPCLIETTTVSYETIHRAIARFRDLYDCQ